MLGRPRSRWCHLLEQFHVGEAQDMLPASPLGEHVPDCQRDHHDREAEPKRCCELRHTHSRDSSVSSGATGSGVGRPFEAAFDR
jgi:hypothetical protein